MPVASAPSGIDRIKQHACCGVCAPVRTPRWRAYCFRWRERAEHCTRRDSLVPANSVAVSRVVVRVDLVFEEVRPCGRFGSAREWAFPVMGSKRNPPPEQCGGGSVQGRGVVGGSVSRAPRQRLRVLAAATIGFLARAGPAEGGAATMSRASGARNLRAQGQSAQASARCPRGVLSPH